MPGGGPNGRISQKNSEKGDGKQKGRGMSLIEKLWSFDAIERLIAKFAPGAMNGVTVTIVGKFDADINRLYNFAIGVATGVVQPIQFNSNQTFSAKIDRLNKAVEISIVYEASGIFQINSIFNGLDLVRNPFYDPIFGGGTPVFISAVSVEMADKIKAAKIAEPPGIATKIASSEPLENPGLRYGNGTFDNSSVTMAPAPLIGPCDIPSAAENIISSNSDLSSQVLRRLRTLFGVP